VDSSRLSSLRFTIFSGLHVPGEVALHSVPFRANNHFLDDELAFVFCIIHPHHELIPLYAEVDPLCERDELIGRLSDNDINNAVRN